MSYKKKEYIQENLDLVPGDNFVSINRHNATHYQLSENSDIMLVGTLNLLDQAGIEVSTTKTIPDYSSNIYIVDGEDLIKTIARLDKTLHAIYTMTVTKGGTPGASGEFTMHVYTPTDIFTVSNTEFSSDLHGEFLDVMWDSAAQNLLMYYFDEDGNPRARTSKDGDNWSDEVTSGYIKIGSVVGAYKISLLFYIDTNNLPRQIFAVNSMYGGVNEDITIFTKYMRLGGDGEYVWYLGSSSIVDAYHLNIYCTKSGTSLISALKAPLGVISTDLDIYYKDPTQDYSGTVPQAGAFTLIKSLSNCTVSKLAAPGCFFEFTSGGITAIFLLTCDTSGNLKISTSIDDAVTWSALQSFTGFSIDMTKLRGGISSLRLLNEYIFLSYVTIEDNILRVHTQLSRDGAVWYHNYMDLTTAHIEDSSYIRRVSLVQLGSNSVLGFIPVESGDTSNIYMIEFRLEGN
jgi:hypothetical protein